MNQQGKRFLVVRLSSLGDLIHTIPAVAALRTSFPSDRIDWLVDRRWVPLVQMVEGLNEVIPLDRSAAGHWACIRRLRKTGYTCAIDFQGLYRSALLTGLSGARVRIGRDRKTAREPGATMFYTDRVHPVGRHIAEMNLSLAERAGAKRPAEMRFPLRVPENECEHLVTRRIRNDSWTYAVMSPGGGWKSKLWPAERYGAVCAELWKKHKVWTVVNVGPGEDSLAAAIVAAAGDSDPMVMTPALPELAAALLYSRLVIGADTGPVHLAAALGKRVLALFGPTDSERNGPLPGGRVLRNSGPEPIEHQRGNYEHRDEYSASMLSITVDQVLEAAVAGLFHAAEGELCMRLEAPQAGDVFRLILSPIEWKEFYALVKFAEYGLEYDFGAAYVVQVFVYGGSEPETILAFKETQAALKGVDRVAEKIPADGMGASEVCLELPKEAMRQLLVILLLSTAAQDQARILHEAIPEKFTHSYPDLLVAPSYYEDVFENILLALHEGRSFRVDHRPRAVPGL